VLSHSRPQCGQDLFDQDRSPLDQGGDRLEMLEGRTVQSDQRPVGPRLLRFDDDRVVSG
jgi:hypothetical protein